MAKRVPKATEDPTTPTEVSAGVEAGMEPAPTPEATPPEYLKVVIILREGRSSIGVQRAGCDPVLQHLPEAGLANAIARLPEVLAEAGARWREQPRFPVYQRPAPPPPRRVGAAPAITRLRRGAAQTTPAQPAPEVQAPRMF